jgi:hypothetical protein
VFFAGTTTKATIYSDDGITAKANPFNADNAGRFDFYAPSGKYDIGIASSTGGLTNYMLTGEVIFDPFEATAADTLLVNSQTLPLNISGIGGFWAVAIFATGWEQLGLQISAANEVRVQQFILPFRAQIGRVSCAGPASASIPSDLGIYDSNGNRLAYTGGFSTSVSVPLTIPLQNAPITLNAGVYYFAQTCASASLFMTHIFDNGSGAIANTGGSKIRGVATNSSSSGVLPITLGGVTINNSLQGYAAAYFER